MKARSLLNIAGLAISFVLPTLAQQKEAIDPKVEQQIRLLAAKFDEAINRHNAVAVAALYTQDGVGEIPESKVSAGHGQQGIEKAYARWFKNWNIHNYFSTVDRVIAVGNEIRSFGKWSDSFKGIEGSTTNFEGHYSWILIREGDTWKIRRGTCSGFFTG
jgi:ketosteroid isomerase-like protein